MNNLVVNVLCSTVTAAVVAGSASISTTKPPPKEIEASKFLLIAPDGSTRAMLGFVNGEPAFVLLDRNGQSRAELSTSAEHSGVYLLNDKKIGVLMECTKKASSLVVKGVDRNEQVVIRTEDAAPVIGLTDGEGKTRLSAALRKGTTSITLFNEKNTPMIVNQVKGENAEVFLGQGIGKERIRLGVDKEGPAIDLRDPNKRPRIILSVDNKGIAMQSFWGQDLNLLTQFLVDAKGSLLQVLGPDEKPVWKVP